jgi:hypothetical protein
LAVDFQLSRALRRLIFAVSLAFLIFIASAVLPFVAGHGISVETYSAPQTSRSYDAFYVNSSFVIDNRALYALNDILYSLNISVSSNRSTVYVYSEALPYVPAGGSVSYNLSVPVYYSSLPLWLIQESAYAGLNLTLYISVSASYAFRLFSFRLNHSMQLSASAMLGSQVPSYAVACHSRVQQQNCALPAICSGTIFAVWQPGQYWRPQL